MAKPDGGPAFPSETVAHMTQGWASDGQAVGIPIKGAPHPGMSLRQWYAAQCPITMHQVWLIYCEPEESEEWPNLLAGDERDEFLKFYASIRFEYADAMIAEGEK